MRGVEQMLLDPYSRFLFYELADGTPPQNFSLKL